MLFYFFFTFFHFICLEIVYICLVSKYLLSKQIFVRRGQAGSATGGRASAAAAAAAAACAGGDRDNTIQHDFKGKTL